MFSGTLRQVEGYPQRHFGMAGGESESMKRRTFLAAGVGGAIAAAARGAYSSGTETESAKGAGEESNMNIVIAADPFAVELKDAVAEHLKSKGYTVMDAGASKENGMAYYDAASAAARLLQEGKADRGILFCGTGAGMAIVANKFRGITAVCTESVFAARMARAINDANVLTMGAMIVAPWMAKEMASAWLDTKHTQGLEQFSDFLKQAVLEVDAIDQKQCQ